MPFIEAHMWWGRAQLPRPFFLCTTGHVTNMDFHMHEVLNNYKKTSPLKRHFNGLSVSYQVFKLYLSIILSLRVLCICYGLEKIAECGPFVTWKVW